MYFTANFPWWYKSYIFWGGWALKHCPSFDGIQYSQQFPTFSLGLLAHRYPALFSRSCLCTFWIWWLECRANSLMFMDSYDTLSHKPYSNLWMSFSHSFHSLKLSKIPLTLAAVWIICLAVPTKSFSDLEFCFFFISMFPRSHY